MAARVNMKFVIGLGTALVLAAVVVVVVGVQAVGRPGGESLVKAGDEAMAAKDYAKAALSYSKAVNKDQRNPEWVRKWLGALKEIRPGDRRTFEDVYNKQYMGALKGLVAADRKSPEAFRGFLDERFEFVRLLTPNLRGWEGYVSEFEDTMKLYAGDEAGRKKLGRYRAIARSQILGINPDLDQGVIDAGLKEANEALEADPSDAEALGAAVAFQAATAERALRTGGEAEGRAGIQAARQRLSEFVERNPTAFTQALGSLQADMGETARQKGAKATLRDLFDAHKGQIDGIARRVLAADPAKVEPTAAVRAAVLAGVVLDGGDKTATEILEHVRKARGQDPMYLLMWARTELQRGEPAKATELAQAALAVPNPPLNVGGYAYWIMGRTEALRVQADAGFTRWDSETEPAKRAEAMETLRAIRGKLVAEAGENSPPVQSIDARLAFANGDINGARTLVTSYNDATGRSDVPMLVLEGEIFLRLNQAGGARTVFTRVLELDKNNVQAHQRMAMIEQAAMNYSESAAHLKTASALKPGDEQLKRNAALMEDLARKDSNDPVAATIKRAIEAVSGVVPDVPRAIETLRDGIKQSPREPRLRAALVRVIAGTGDREGARRAVDEGLAAVPGDAQLASLKKALDVEDPAEAARGNIETANLTPWQKALARYELANRSGKKDEGKEALAEALRLAPEDPVVLEYAFGAAVTGGDLKEAERLATVAERVNADRVGGLLFKGRVQMAREQSADAAVTFEEITKKDKLNLMAWRLLGLCKLRAGQAQQAVDALRQGVAIRPDDAASNIALIQALSQVGRADDALAAARKVETQLSGEPDFRELLLQLEGAAPSGDKEKAIAARRTLAAKEPANTGNRQQLATLLTNAKRYDEAKTIIDGLLAADPQDMVGVQLMSAWLAAQNRVTEAVKVLKDFIAGLPEGKRTEGLYINASRLLQLLGQPDAADEMLVSARPLQDKAKMLVDRELGDVRFGREKFAEAVEAYERVLAGGEDKQNAVRKRIIECRLRSRDFEGMRRAVAELGAAGQADAAVILLQAEAAVAEDKRADAERLYNQAASAEPKNPIVYLKRGDFRLLDPTGRRLTDAEADYQQMITLEPCNVLARLRLVDVYARQGRDDESVEQIKRAIECDPTNNQLRVALVMRHIELGRAQDAARAADDGVRQFEGRLDWRLRAGELWASVGNYAKAAEHLAEAWKQRKTPDVGGMFGEVLLGLGSYDDASRVLASPDLKVEERLPLRLLRARLWAKQGRTADAARELVTIASSKTLVPPADRERVGVFMTGLSAMYPKGEDQVRVLATLEQGGRKLEGFMAVEAAKIRLRNNAREAALADLEALSTGSGDKKVQASALSLLGQVAYGESNFKEARRRFEAGAQANPEDPELGNNLAYVLASKMGECSAALPYAQKAVELAPNTSGFHDTLGVVQLCAGDPDAALKSLGVALVLARNDGERLPVHVHMTRSLLAKKDQAGARDQWERVNAILGRSPSLEKQYEADVRELRDTMQRQ